MPSRVADPIAAKRRPMESASSIGAGDVLGPARERLETGPLAECGAYFHQRGWSLGTSSNYSVVLSRDPLRLLITASGKDKGRLGPNDFVIVDGDGRRVANGAAADVDADPPARPSAETLLHTMLASRPGVGAVRHTHSV